GGTCTTPLCSDAGCRELDCSPASHGQTGLEKHGPRAIALIDSRVPFQEELLRSIDPDVYCFALTSETTFRTITEILGQYRNLEALHLVAHGAPGQLYLGGTWVTTQTLLNHGEHIAQWGESLAPNADLLIYGCHSGASPQGQRFLETWRSLLTANASDKTINIAAASHGVGSPKVGASWSLDRILGRVRSALAWDEAAIAPYPIHLGVPNQFYGIARITDEGDNGRDELVTVDLLTGEVTQVFQNLPLPEAPEGGTTVTNATATTPNSIPAPIPTPSADSIAIARRPGTNEVYYVNNRLSNGGQRSVNSQDEFKLQIGFHTFNGNLNGAGQPEAVLGSGENTAGGGQPFYFYDSVQPGVKRAGRAGFDRNG
ncbi:MAG: DUF4347 domain-containing protein, partial [Cyanobacteria bacterium P01_H01_bin.130]